MAWQPFQKQLFNLAANRVPNYFEAKVLYLQKQHITMRLPSIITGIRLFKTPSSYIKFYNRNRHDIEHVKVIPPKLGDTGFGKFEVTLKPHARYRST